VIQGTAVDDDGAPVAEARVVVLDGPAPMPDVALLTGPDGSFVLGTPAPGTYRLAVHADGFDSVEATVDVQSDRPAAVLFRLERSGRR
jgi:hypothetical protein